MGSPPPSPTARRGPAAWLVPLSVLLALLLGAAIAGEIRLTINPSGTVQNPSTTPTGEQLDTLNVALLWGAPYAALAAALVSHLGLRRPHPGMHALAGVCAGVLVFALFGFDAVPLGQWWVASAPADTNRATALFTFLLVPPGALATQLAAFSDPIPPAGWARPSAVRFLLVGVVFGLILGSLLGSLTATLTWAVNCPQTGYVNCFPVSSVVSSALLIGGLAGMAIGAVTGSVAWLLRWRATGSG